MGAAAAAAVILGVGLIHSNDEVSRLQSAPASQPTGVVSALEAPGHKVVNLGNGGAGELAQFVLADGRGYLVSSALPALKSSETYQLWGLVNGQPISLGLLGQVPVQLRLHRRRLGNAEPVAHHRRAVGRIRRAQWLPRGVGNVV